MKFKLLSILLLFFVHALKANEIEIIELHTNKSLDQLVLDSENLSKVNNDNELSIDKQDEEENSSLEINQDDGENSNNLNNNVNQSEVSEDSNTLTNEVVAISETKTIFEINEKILSKHLNAIGDVKSDTLNRELINILSNPELGDQTLINNNIFFIIKKLYEIGEIGKAYNLIKSIDLNNVVDQEKLNYIFLINLNYLFSTYKLSEACEFKTFLLEKTVTLPKFLIEKTDIFCLILENKFAEAKLLNSLLIESEKENDSNYQNLFNYMILNSEDNREFETFNAIKSKELIFLYSAMLRINELPLNQEFIEIDPLNLSIPVILSNSTRMDIRIKAANKAFYDEVLSIESLSALYQSVDFSSKDFNNPEQTIISLDNNKELIMAFYYQLANIQIFPDQRLAVVIDYWKFAKKEGLEKIAYEISKNIIDTFNPSIENLNFAIDIALAHISNKNFTESLKWIDIYESSNSQKNEKLEYAKFLISLNENNELDTVINYLSSNYGNFSNIENQKLHETMQVLINYLNLSELIELYPSYDLIEDDRLMPSYFLLRDIENNIYLQNDLSVFILTLISINEKKWIELHPQHLNFILSAYNSYDNGSLIKPILIEILKELEIFND